MVAALSIAPALSVASGSSASLTIEQERRYFTEDDGWSGWSAYGEPLDGAAAYQPAVCEYDGALHVVVAADNGHAYYTAYDGEYTEWADLGDNYAYDPYTYEYDGDYYLTYTGENGYLYYKEYAGEKEGGY